MESKRFKNWQYPKFNRNGVTKWQWMCQHRRGLKLGKNVDIGAFTYINAKYGVTIEEDVQIGSHCAIYSESTIDNKSGPVKICKNAKVGSHCTIMPNVTIGEDSIIGAHSFVNHDIGKNVIAFGTPANVRREAK